jgi:rare lipoprotein A
MHVKLSLVTDGADAGLVNHRSDTRVRRARLICATAVACVVFAVLCSSTALADGDGGDISGGPLVDLGSGETPFEPSSTPQANAGESLVPGEDTMPEGTQRGVATPIEEEPITGTDKQLQLQRAQLVSQRNSLQQRLLDTEDTRRAAELRHDDALAAIAARLVSLFEGGEDARVQALMSVRDEQDPDLRSEQTRALAAADRALITALDTTAEQVDTITQASERLRLQVLTVGTKVAAIDAVIAERAGPTASELARERGERYSIDADYVFATGPIPGIGYWGAMSGGGMLNGWMGYAGAAVGGVGCTPPDPSLHATGSVESGEASWYGPGFQGNNTANGETFDTAQLTAAHKTLPFGTMVRVTSSATGRCAFVRINDRGPYVDGRIIDLSRAAADAIGMESVAPVQLEIYAAS